MSLVRLLTAGKSLVGLSDSANRYRMGDPRALPKFGSAKNPFRTTNPEAARKEVRGWQESRRPGESLAGEQVGMGATQVSIAAGDTVGQAESGKASSQAVTRTKGAGWFRRWASKLKARFSREPAKAAKPAGTGIPRFEKLPVQGELSLDSIKVVRNDLSDADLEIVPIKPRPVVVCEPPVAPGAGMAGVTGTSWGRAATRLLGVGKS